MVKPRVIPLETAASLFLADRKSRGYAVRTIEFYTEKTGHFRKFCSSQNVSNLEDVTPHIVRAYFAWMMELNWAPYTRNIYGRAVRAFLRWCVAEELVKQNPLRNVRIPQPPKEIAPALKPKDVQDLLAAAEDARTRAIILVFLDTGIRAREFIDLQGSDVDVYAGTLRVRRGKTGKSRMTFLSPPTTRALLAYYGEYGMPDENGPHWLNQRTGERLQYEGLKSLLRRVANAAKVKGVKPHAFRRTFALWSLRQGVDTHTLAKLMGHADIMVLKRYLDIDESDTRAAHEKASIIKNFLK